ncbi:MAG: carbon monoxide dehydrogenase subunit, partial [Conexibacter sp.]|nr:carbon monoxide dehydrogenase subunit [Conexibacter sp.]
MRVQQSFVIAEPREKLWEFFEQVDQVAACVPGVESVEQVDADNSRIRMTQSVGPMSATFDLRMKITDRKPLELMEFTAIGRAVRGAAGNVRTTNTVRLAEVAEGTRVELESELAMGGVLGSVGQKVIARQAGQVTQQFSDSLERAIKGEPAQAAAAPAAAAPDTAPDPATANGAAASATAAPGGPTPLPAP